MDRKYLSVTDTAKLMRAALKESFPGMKFSVKCGTSASVHVRWTDGPTDDQVDAVIGVFEGAYFDGMIDYRGAKYAKLDGVDVRFGAAFVRADRDYSDKLVQAAIDQVAEEYGDAGKPTVDAWRNRVINESPIKGAIDHRYCWTSLVYEALGGMAVSPWETTKASATLARIQSAGDDGYGQGTVGTAENPGGERGYSAIEKSTWRKPEPVDAVQMPAHGVIQ